jgi:hypothetical protein
MLKLALVTTAQNHSTGVVDEVRAYDRTLSAAEIYQLYNMGR